MEFISDITFWLTTAVIITGLVVLFSPASLKSKGWLAGFLILSLLSSAGFYVPNLLHRNELMTFVVYQRIIEQLGLVFQIFRMGAWALLLVFILSWRFGEESGATTGSTRAADSLPPPSPVPDSPYQGYGGWLAFFGGLQLFVAPAIAIVLLVIGSTTIGEASSRYPSILVVYFVESLVNVSIVALGMYAAVQLRRIRPGAVRAAKRYLLAALAWSALSFLLPYLGDMPEGAREKMFVQNFKGLLRTAIAVAIWLTYFNVSRRVKATYTS